ncbi:hypothetical protein PAXINDRAFT_155685 [Paxillus involutus ATCC 200175]|uniref:Uncharacterized protein n=1 Tax=Paxillus involutus ATCC 200175 TaxID=664439 RepID=A0A0C9TYG9_PAXIN|nr:hypothetical protein PAXINDRAFT_155685 [Paxillus involutus ATCC 200175]
MHRGPNRASFMWGLSTHNTRIEHVHPDLLLRYYGIDSLTVGDSDADEVEEMRQTLEGEIAQDMQGNLNHEATLLQSMVALSHLTRAKSSFCKPSQRYTNQV